MQVRKSVLAGYSAERMFDLIEAAEHYPAFLPWCSGATIVERDDAIVAADITVDYHGVRFQFRTRNPKRRPEWMSIRLEHGPFRHFEGEWNLQPLGADGCRIGFDLGYDFRSTMMSKLAGPVFDRIANTLVDAFVARADIVYRAVTPVAFEPPAATPPLAAPATEAPADTQSRAIPGADPNRSELS